MAVGDIVWLADQNALRGQYRLAKVVNVNMDKKGIVRDVNVRTFPSYSVPLVKPMQHNRMSKVNKTTERLKIPATVLHRDVRRVVVLLPIEEQHHTESKNAEEDGGKRE